MWVKEDLGPTLQLHGALPPWCHQDLDSLDDMLPEDFAPQQVLPARDSGGYPGNRAGVNFLRNASINTLMASWPQCHTS